MNKAKHLTLYSTQAFSSILSLWKKTQLSFILSKQCADWNKANHTVDFAAFSLELRSLALKNYPMYIQVNNIFWLVAWLSSMWYWNLSVFFARAYLGIETRRNAQFLIVYFSHPLLLWFKIDIYNFYLMIFLIFFRPILIGLCPTSTRWLQIRLCFWS